MTAPRGLIVIDKPIGPTSHDVVGKLRRLFQTKRVGHAGTLDPMATGVLIGLVGEATKLATWLTLDDKAYVARVTFGRSTDSLDSTGKTTHEALVPDWLQTEVAAVARGDLVSAALLGGAFAVERARTAQLPPAFSAIQKDGVRAHSAARAGRALDLPPRDVVVRTITLRGASTLDDGPPGLDVELDVGKGYYVRAFARDLGETLGVPSCLEALRRVRSGPFDIERAIRLDELARLSPEERAARLVPLREIARLTLPCATLTDEGLRRASLGQRLAAEHFATATPASGPFAWLDADGELMSVGDARDEGFAVVRNIVPADAPVDAPDEQGAT